MLMFLIYTWKFENTEINYVAASYYCENFSWHCKNNNSIKLLK